MTELGFIAISAVLILVGIWLGKREIQRQAKMTKEELDKEWDYHIW